MCFRPHFIAKVMMSYDVAVVRVEFIPCTVLLVNVTCDVNVSVCCSLKLCTHIKEMWGMENMFKSFTEVKKSTTSICPASETTRMLSYYRQNDPCESFTLISGGD